MEVYSKEEVSALISDMRYENAKMMQSLVHYLFNTDKKLMEGLPTELKKYIDTTFYPQEIPRKSRTL